MQDEAEARGLVPVQAFFQTVSRFPGRRDYRPVALAEGVGADSRPDP